MATFNIKKILVPVDFSEAGEKAITQAISMAKATNANITLVHVIESPANTYGPDYLGASRSFRNEFESMLHDAIKNKMEEIKKQVTKEGIKEVDYFIESGKVYKKINELAKELRADIIMMGTHGVSGFKEFLVGSNTFRVIGDTTCPVLSFQKQGKKAGFSSILLPFRDSLHSKEGVEHAIQIAKIYGATIHVLGINIDTDETALKKMQFEAKQIKDVIEKRGVECTTDVLTSNYLASLILSFAENKKADLIVIMADVDKMELREYIIGPVAQQIVNHSKIPVLSIHPAYNPSVVNQANPIMD